MLYVKKQTPVGFLHCVCWRLQMRFVCVMKIIFTMPCLQIYTSRTGMIGRHWVVFGTGPLTSPTRSLLLDGWRCISCYAHYDLLHKDFPSCQSKQVKGNCKFFLLYCLCRSVLCRGNRNYFVQWFIYVIECQFVLLLKTPKRSNVHSLNILVTTWGNSI